MSITRCIGWDDGNGDPAGDSKDLGVLNDYDYRGFDIAYEANSGRALVVGSNGTSLNYWIWNGCSLYCMSKTKCTKVVYLSQITPVS